MTSSSPLSDMESPLAKARGNACSALDKETRTCRHGFIVSLGCDPMDGQWHRYMTPWPVPMCCNEDWCARVFAWNDGRPNPRQSTASVATAPHHPTKEGEAP